MRHFVRYIKIGQGGDKLHEPRSNVVTRVLAVIGTVILIGLSLTISLFLFALLLVIGVCVWAYLWWKTRALRQQLREFAAAAERTSAKPDDTAAEVYEGVVIREIDECNESDDDEESHR